MNRKSSHLFPIIIFNHPIITGARSPQTFSSSNTGFPFQVNHATAIANLTAPAIHSAAAMPALDLCSQAPRIPPATNNTTADTLLFRFTFSPNGASTRGSDSRSQYSEVSTLVGTSLKPRTRLVTIWPPNWKASRARGARVMGSSAWRVWAALADTVPRRDMWNAGAAADWARAAEVRIRRDWTRKERARVDFCLGWTWRVWLKVRQPAQKAAMETRALSQRVEEP